MNQQAITYKKASHSALSHNTKLSEHDEKIALERFTTFLQGIGSPDYIATEIENVYAENAYLNDTLKTLNTRSKIKAHFIKTSKAMTSYSVSIDDISASTQGHYIRWTMEYTAPKFAKGQPIKSIGISHIIFDNEGKIILHQDFWDSNAGFFEHIPIIGGGIRMVKKRL